MTDREMAVAGMFYPADSAECQVAVESLLARYGSKVATAAPPLALILPHAGYIYSGPVAAQGLNYLLAADLPPIERVVLLGPPHRAPVKGMATLSALCFKTPLGRVEVDQDLMAPLIESGLLSVDDNAHALEHSLEVQLPLLMGALSDEFTIVPVLIGNESPSRVAELINQLADERTLIVVSSDLSHFQVYEQACHIDAETCERIVGMQGGVAPNQACGCHAINGLCHWARQNDLEAVLVVRNNSGDMGGNRQRVVGYAAFAFH